MQLDNLPKTEAEMPPDLGGLGKQLEQMLRTAAPDAVMRAKQRRFTTSARLLTNKQKIDVFVVDSDALPPAWYDIRKKNMTLNEAHPRTQDAVTALIYDRGKLYHELFHELFTKALDHRRKLAEKSRNKTLFLDISNMLEDGRIEWLGVKKWPGAQFYLDSLRMEWMKNSNKHPLTGLVLYVRKQIWRNKNESEFWAPFIPQIGNAIRAINSRKVCDIAFEIVEALIDRDPKLLPPPPPPPQPPTKEGEEGTPGPVGEGETQEPEGEKSPDDSETETKTAGDGEGATEETDSGSEGSESDEGGEDTEEEAEGDSEADSDGDDDEESEEGSEETGHGHGGLDALDDETFEKMEKMVENASEGVKEEAAKDYESILEEALTEYEPEQPFNSSHEEMLADDLNTVFRSLLVEANREKRHEAKEGKLNTLALPKALTNQRCFERNEIAPSPPFVALLLDTSGSMRDVKTKLTSAARVIHGGLLKAKVEVLTATFGGYGSFARHNIIPTESFKAHGTTPTGTAMAAANKWLAENGANHALVIVVTAGDPNKVDHAKAQQKQ